jgi:hypothetical protein
VPENEIVRLVIKKADALGKKYLIGSRLGLKAKGK